MSTSQLTMARQHFYFLLTVVWSYASMIANNFLFNNKLCRPEAISLIDAFDFPDQLLCSVLGRDDREVYKHMLKWAKNAPRNESEVIFPCQL